MIGSTEEGISMTSQDDWNMIRQVLEEQVDLEELFDKAIQALDRRVKAHAEDQLKIEELHYECMGEDV